MSQGAPKVRLDPKKQVPLEARKALAARILHMLLENALEGLKPDGADSADFSVVVKQQIKRMMREDPLDDPWPLDVFLENLREAVKKHTSAYSGEAFEAARQRLLPLDPHFGCGICGEAGRTCTGALGDRDMLGHQAGGLCLRFLKGMVERFAAIAENTYVAAAEIELSTDLIPPLAISTSHIEGDGGTLPLDGEFNVPAKVGGEAYVAVLWPDAKSADQDLDAAIRSMPYLVFHEVFVHGAQGAALPGARFLVDPDCAFTEGAVDCVAYEVLAKYVLPSDQHFPKLLEPLRDEFSLACQEYNTARMKPPSKGSTKSGDEIRRARYFGRAKIYDRLLEIAGEPMGLDAATWVTRVVLTLNLYLPPYERHEFFKLINKAAERSKVLLSLFDPLDQFLTERDVGKLFDEMRRASGIKMHSRQKRIDFLGKCI